MNDSAHFTAEEAAALVGRRCELTTQFGELEAGTEGLIVETTPTPSGGRLLKIEWYSLGPIAADFMRNEAVFPHTYFNKSGFRSFLRLIEED